MNYSSLCPVGETEHSVKLRGTLIQVEILMSPDQDNTVVYSTARK